MTVEGEEEGAGSEKDDEDDAFGTQIQKDSSDIKSSFPSFVTSRL